MCYFAGMHLAANCRMIPVINAVYKERYTFFKKLNFTNPEKAHLDY